MNVSSLTRHLPLLLLLPLSTTTKCRNLIFDLGSVADFLTSSKEFFFTFSTGFRPGNVVTFGQELSRIEKKKKKIETFFTDFGKINLHNVGIIFRTERQS